MKSDDPDRMKITAYEGGTETQEFLYSFFFFPLAAALEAAAASLTSE
jgi:hypothetical protein